MVSMSSQLCPFQLGTQEEEVILNSSRMLQLGSAKSSIGQGQQVLPKVSLSKESCGEAICLICLSRLGSRMEHKALPSPLGLGERRALLPEVPWRLAYARQGGKGPHGRQQPDSPSCRHWPSPPLRGFALRY